MSGSHHRLWVLAGICCLTAFGALPAPASARTVYVTGTSGVAALSVNADGTLTPVTDSPFAAGTGPGGVVLTADSTKLFVANQVSNNISAFRVRADGGLDSVGAPVPSGANSPIALVATPDGRYLYVVNTSNAITGFAIGSDGSLNSVGPPTATDPAITSPRVPSVSSDGQLLFVPGNGSTNIAAWRINADGTLSGPGTPAPTEGTGVVYSALAPDASRVYVNNWFSDSVAAFDFTADGALTEVTGSPFTTGAGTNPMGLRPSLDGDHLYSALRGTEELGRSPIAANGSLGMVTVGPSGANDPSAVAQTSDGGRIYVAHGVVSNNVGGFNVDPASGAPSWIAGSPFTSGAGTPSFQSIAVSPNQGPTASGVVVSADPRSLSVELSGADSVDSDGSIVTFTYDYGDGTVEAGPSSAGAHTYSAPGSYTAKLTVVDNEGCSTATVTTGQTVSCNGGAKAAIEIPVDFDPPRLKLAGKRKQKLGRAVGLKASCDEACAARARGVLVVSTPAKGAAPRRLKLKKATRDLVADVPGKLRLRIKRRVRKKVVAAFENGAKVRARIRVKAKDSTGNQAGKRRAVRIRP